MHLEKFVYREHTANFGLVDREKGFVGVDDFI